MFIAGRVALFGIAALLFAAARLVAHPGPVRGGWFGGASVGLGAASIAFGAGAMRDRELLSQTVERTALGASPEVAAAFGVAGCVAGCWLLVGRRLSGVVASVGAASAAAGLWVLDFGNLDDWLIGELGLYRRGPQFLLAMLALLVVLAAEALTARRIRSRGRLG